MDNVIDKIKNELTEFGNVEFILNCDVFALYMTRDKVSLSQGRIPFKILEILLKYLGKEKPNIGGMTNDDDFLFVRLKP